MADIIMISPAPQIIDPIRAKRFKDALGGYVGYYHDSRSHLALKTDARTRESGFISSLIGGEETTGGSVAT